MDYGGRDVKALEEELAGMESALAKMLDSESRDDWTEELKAAKLRQKIEARKAQIAARQSLATQAHYYDIVLDGRIGRGWSSEAVAALAQEVKAKIAAYEELYGSLGQNGGPPGSNTASRSVVCDRCDGPHETEACPIFRKPRDSHPDAQKGR